LDVAAVLVEPLDPRDEREEPEPPDEREEPEPPDEEPDEEPVEDSDLDPPDSLLDPLDDPESPELLGAGTEAEEVLRESVR
jgi:hypothetical protein